MFVARYVHWPGVHGCSCVCVCQCIFRPIHVFGQYRPISLAFTNRVIPTWKSLSNHVVTADTVDTFKNRLDNFWSTQEEM